MTLSGSTGHHWIETVDKGFMMLSAKCSLLMVKACAKPPTEQIEAAEKAIKVVQANDASTHIRDEYTKIEGTLSALKEEVTHQDGKLALFRDYGKIWQLAQGRWRSPIGICQSGADSNRHSRLSDHTNSGESHSRKESGRFSRNRDSPCQDRREKTLCGEEEVR